MWASPTRPLASTLVRPAADRLTEEKYLTQQQVVAAASKVVMTSKSRITRCARDLVDVYLQKAEE